MALNKVKVVTWFNDSDEAKTLFVDYFPSYQLTDEIYLTTYDHNHTVFETLVESEKFPGCYEYDKEICEIKPEGALKLISDIGTMSATELLIHIAKYKN